MGFQRDYSQAQSKKFGIVTMIFLIAAVAGGTAGNEVEVRMWATTYDGHDVILGCRVRGTPRAHRPRGAGDLHQPAGGPRGTGSSLSSGKAWNSEDG